MNKKIIRVLNRVFNKYSIEEKAGPEGRVELLLRDKNGKFIERRIGKNALSPVAKARAVFTGGEFLGCNTPFLLGKSFILGDCVDTYEPSGSTYAKSYTYNCPGIYLLNLTGKEGQITDHFVPVYEKDGSLDRAVVIGCGNSNTTATGDDFYGVCLSDADTNMLTGLTNYYNEFFNTGKGTGHITHVATMNFLGGTNGDTRYPGSSAWKCLSKTPVTTAYAPPGCPGITEKNEIMVFNEFNGVQAYKVNLDTGGTKEVKTNITREAIGFDGATGRKATLLFDTNKLAVIDYNVCKILELDGAGKTCKELFTSSELNAHLTDGYGLCGIYIADNTLCFSATRNYEAPISTQRAYILKVPLGTGTYKGSTYYTSGEIGGLPADPAFNADRMVINAYHAGKWYLTDTWTNKTIICTDKMDIAGTMIGSIGRTPKSFDVISTESKFGIMISSRGMDYYAAGQAKVLNNMTDLQTGTETKEYIVIGGLLWICDGLYSNYWTLYKLSSPIDKGADETLEVQYNLKWAE